MDEIIVSAVYRSDYEKNGFHKIDKDGKLARMDATDDQFSWTKRFVVSPSGEHVAYHHDDQRDEKSYRSRPPRATISRLDGSGSHVYGPEQADGEYFSNIEWSRDGQRIYYASWKRVSASSCPDGLSETKIWSMSVNEDGPELAGEISPAAAAWSIKPAADGDAFALVAFGCGDNPSPFKIWADGELRDLTPSLSYTDPRMAGISWSPDGTRVAILDNARDARAVLHIVNPDGTGLVMLVRRNEDGSLAPG